MLNHKTVDRVRKEFEKWAILTYSDNRVVINEKKGADNGIDSARMNLPIMEEVAKKVSKAIKTSQPSFLE